MAAKRKPVRAARSTGKRRAKAKRATATPATKRAAAKRAAARPAAKRATARPKRAAAQPAPTRPQGVGAKRTGTKRTSAKRTAAKRTATPRTATPTLEVTTSAVPEPIGESPSGQLATDSGPRRARTARERSMRSSPVVEIVDDPHPIGALRRFLDSIKGEASVAQGQIALGAAQLLLLPIAREHRGGHDVKELLDMMLERWATFPDRAGFHAQEFLRNALAAVGVDRERIAKLAALVPASASAELRFNVACAHAVARDKVAMLRAVEAALDAGASASQFERDHDFVPYRLDPDLAALLARADVPAIPVDLAPYLDAVRRALDSVVATLRELGENPQLRPPVKLAAILDAERARKISLPNDYRALLTITNGMVLWDHEFFAAGDYREPTDLAVRGQRFLAMAASHGAAGIDECVPLARWAQPNDWLLYDPRGRLRGGAPGYVVHADASDVPLDGLVAVLGWLERLAREVLGTN